MLRSLIFPQLVLEEGSKDGNPSWVNLVLAAGTRWLQSAAPDRAAKPGWELREHTDVETMQSQKTGNRISPELNGCVGGHQEAAPKRPSELRPDQEPQEWNQFPKTSKKFYQVVRYASNFISDFSLYFWGNLPQDLVGLCLCVWWVDGRFLFQSIAGGVIRLAKVLRGQDTQTRQGLPPWRQSCW